MEKDISNKKEKALQIFYDNMNCSQAVLGAYADEYGLDLEQAMNLSLCFSAGMRDAQVCGAVSGAVMVLGLMYGSKEDGKALAYEKTTEFLYKFQKEKGSILCKDLLSCNITTQGGRQYALDHHYFQEICPKMVEYAVELLEENRMSLCQNKESEEKKDIWEAYYHETEVERRATILEKIATSENHDRTVELRQKLFLHRYQKKKRSKEYADQYLMELLVLLSYKDQMRVFNRKGNKVILSALKNLGMQEILWDNEEQKTILYQEYRNLAKRYYETTQSANYGKKFFGTVQISQDEKLMLAAKDTYFIAEKLPEIFHLEKEMQLLSKALLDEFKTISKDAVNIYEKCH